MHDQRGPERGQDARREPARRDDRKERFEESRDRARPEIGARHDGLQWIAGTWTWNHFAWTWIPGHYVRASRW